jgi:hypothetical protein
VAFDLAVVELRGAPARSDDRLASIRGVPARSDDRLASIRGVFDTTDDGAASVRDLPVTIDDGFAARPGSDVRTDAMVAESRGAYVSGGGRFAGCGGESGETGMKPGSSG